MTALSGSGAIRKAVGLQEPEPVGLPAVAGVELRRIAELEFLAGDPACVWLRDGKFAFPDLPALLLDRPGSGEDDGRAVILTLASEFESLLFRDASLAAIFAALSLAFLAASSNNAVAMHFGTLWVSS